MEEQQLYELLQGCSNWNISQAETAARKRRIKVALRILGYMVQFALDEEHEMTTFKLDRRLPCPSHVVHVEAKNEWTLESSLRQSDSTLPWIFHNVRHYVEQISARMAFFSDTMQAYETDQELTLKAHEALRCLRVRLRNPSATIAQQQRYMILISWHVDFDSTGHVVSDLTLALASSQAATAGSMDVNRMFQALLIQGTTPLNTALRAIVNRLQEHANH